MKVLVKYIESKIPRNAESVLSGVEYFNEEVPIRAELIESKKEIKENIQGIKEIGDIKLLRVLRDTFEYNQVKFKPRDKIILFGKEYIIDSVVEKITNEKHANFVANNPQLYERYVERMLVLK